MALKVVGAGLGRTGTHSLKLALEQLLGGPCYHMLEVIGHPDHVPVWHRAIKGEDVDWNVLFEDYVAAVDWPEVSMWRELHAAYPDAPVLLSVRDSTESWWKSFSQTIFVVMQRGPATEDDPWFAMSTDMMRRFCPEGMEPDALKAAYERHNQEVRDTVPPGQLIEWRPRDGWGPICAGLGMPVPDGDFPHVNTTDDFRTMLGLSAEG